MGGCVLHRENNYESKFEGFQSKIKELIQDRRWGELRGYLTEWRAPDIADLMIDLDTAERILLFRILQRPLSSEVFAYLEPLHKDALLKDLSDEESRRLLHDLTPDDLTDYLEELPGQAVQRSLNLLSPEDLKKARILLGYPEDSVGRLMTPDYVAVRPEWTVGQALTHIRNRGKDSETINVIYVTDSSWKLLDVLDLRRFILAESAVTIAALMDYSFISIPVTEDREEAVRMMQHYDLIALPVVDSEGVLLGIVTVDDALDVVQEETTEDFQKTAAVEPLKMSYREAGIWSLYSKRIVWLCVFLGINLLTAGIIAAYEEVLRTAITLTMFIPLLGACGGNTGAQSSTLIVRALAVGDVRVNQWLSSVGRELIIGFLLGITMGAGGWMLGFFSGGWNIAAVVFSAMLCIVLVSNIIGVIVPFMLLKLKFDPAVASSPLITSIADVVGLFIYFSIAAGVLKAA
ncbi:MAG: magnesium transporter [Acidobacteria bacterium]|nr:magnesium transporter [Acidobacteriota bacterium]